MREFLAAFWPYLPGWIADGNLWWDYMKARIYGLLGSPRSKARHQPEGCTYECCGRAYYKSKRGQRRSVRRIEKRNVRKEIMSNICGPCKRGEHCDNEWCFCQHRPPKQTIAPAGIASKEAVGSTGKENEDE